MSSPHTPQFSAPSRTPTARIQAIIQQEHKIKGEQTMSRRPPAITTRFLKGCGLLRLFGL